MIYTCPKCKEKIDEIEGIVKNVDENQQELYCPNCGERIASVRLNEANDNAFNKEGFSIQDEYKVGARKLRQPETEETPEIEEVSGVEEVQEAPETSSELSEFEINRLVSDFAETLTINNKQSLIDEKEADLRFDLKKSVENLLNASKWLQNRNGGSENYIDTEYDILGIVSKFS